MKQKLLWIWAVSATLAAAVLAIMVAAPTALPPVADRGHRVFGIMEERARPAVLEVLEKTAGLKPHGTFDSGPTHQTLMKDGFTVINRMDKAESLAFYSASGLSLPVADPRASAKLAHRILTDAGYEADWEEIKDPNLPPNSLVAVRSTAFDDWALVYRRHLLRMPQPQWRK